MTFYKCHTEIQYTSKEASGNNVVSTDITFVLCLGVTFDGLKIFNHI